jgi:processive 1,2-diacylglycerol beta-glucosyltransferase
MTQQAGNTPARRRVLIASASIGAGHHSVAAALIESLAAAAPQIETVLVDILDFAPWWFRAYYAGGFALGMTRLPLLYGLGFVVTNRPQTAQRGAFERFRLAVERRALRRVEQYLAADRFDLIVNTHFVGASVIGRMIRQGRLKTPQVIVVTDIEVHRLWYAQDVEHWFAPSQYSAQPLRRWGIGEDRISVTGIPIRSKWTAPLDRRRVLADWNLPAGRPIVVLTGGTEFVCGAVVRIARGIMQACPDCCLVVLAGRNKKLLEQLSRLGEPADRLAALSFTDRAHELVEVCRLMVTKPGGVTTAECLAKGTPMVFLKSTPGHEAGNAEFLAHNGAAVLTGSAEDTVATVARLLRNQQLLEHLSANARRLHQPAAATIAAAICRMLGLAPGSGQPVMRTIADRNP